MALFQILNKEELDAFRERYRNNDLFRHWSPILSQIERQYDGRDAISLWACSEQCLNQLRQIRRYRETEIDYILRELLQETDVTTAVTVMCIVLMRLMNAVEKGNEDEAFENEPMCIAIMSIMQNSREYKPVFDVITQEFFRRKYGFDEKPVVIQPSDPMLGTLTIDDLTAEAREKMEKVMENVFKKTQPLQTFWGEDKFEQWKNVWKDICLDTRLFTMLCHIEPRGNAWGINEKMVCNVIGMYNSNLEKPAKASTISSSLEPKKNRRNYIMNTSVKAGTDSVFNKQEDLYTSVEIIIVKHLQQA